MKKLFFSFLTAMMFASCVTVNADKNMISREYQVKGSFSSINVSGNVDVDYTPSNQVNIVASANAEILSTLKVYVKNNTIYLDTEPTKNNRKIFSDGRTVKVKLSAPVMDSYSTSGNSEIDIKGPVNLQEETLKVSTSGNSEIEFGYKADCKAAKVVTTGNSKVDFDNQLVCTTFDANSSGNSSIDVNFALCDKIVLDSSGNSGIDVDGISAKSVAAESSGNSTIKLSGSADSANLQSSGNSEIKARKLNARNVSSSTNGNSSIAR